MNKKTIELPDKICAIIDRLKVRGYHGYAVGGCVRDMLMDKTPHDFDITTDAFPSETAQCFADCEIILTGLKHGTVTVVYEGENIEITTFRTDGEYLDNRHPKEVTFVRNIAEDLSRRDFTVNAMAYNPDEGLIDLFDGEKDLERRIIKCVGDSDTRFNEDGLRILRAMRFASVLGFEIEEKTAESVIRNRELLKNISAERIYSEFTKLLLGDGVLKIMSEFYSVVAEILGDVPFKNIKAAANAPKDHSVRYASLLADRSADEAGKVMRGLKTDNETHRLVKKLVASLAFELPKRSSDRFEKDVSHLLSEHGYSDLRKMISLRKAFDAAEGRLDENLDAISQTVDRLEFEDACISIKQLSVSGSDLAEIGIPKSPEMGKILKELLKMVIEGEIENDKCALIQKAKNITARI